MKTLFFISTFIVLKYSYSLENGLARTPPMGWMSWTVFLCETDCVKHPKTCISEKLYMEMADRMAEDGYKVVGYDIVHIDDCYFTKKRSLEGKLMVDPDRFPNGMPKLADYVHKKGLKLGLYGDYGHYTCMGYPGSYGHLEEDAQTFSDWGADYLKFDGCNIDPQMYPIGYPQMARALNRTGRPIVFACSWPAYLLNQPRKVNYTEIGQACNLWRNFMPDVEANWSIIMKIVNYYTESQDKLIAANGPGHWNDPDMIVVGDPRLTPDQSRAQMTLWSIWSAPLIMSNDLRTIEPVYKEILLNKRVIEVDQDPLGIMGRMIKKIGTKSIYVKKMLPCDEKLQICSYAVAILNRGQKEVTSFFKLRDIGLNQPSGYKILELWDGQDMGLFQPSDTYQTSVPATGVHLLKATPISFENEEHVPVEEHRNAEIPVEIGEETESYNYYYLFVVVILCLIYCVMRRLCRNRVIKKINLL